MFLVLKICSFAYFTWYNKNINEPAEINCPMDPTQAAHSCDVMDYSKILVGIRDAIPQDFPGFQAQSPPLQRRDPIRDRAQLLLHPRFEVGEPPHQFGFEH